MKQLQKGRAEGVVNSLSQSVNWSSYLSTTSTKLSTLDLLVLAQLARREKRGG